MPANNEMQPVIDFGLSEGAFQAAWEKIDQLTPAELIRVISEKRKTLPEQSSIEKIPLAQFLLISLCDLYLDVLAKKNADLKSFFVPLRGTRTKHFDVRVGVIKEIYKGILTALKFGNDSPLREDLARFVEPVFEPSFTKSTLKSIIIDACEKYDIKHISADGAPLHCVVTTQSRLRMTKAQASDNIATQKVKDLEQEIEAQNKTIQEQKEKILSLERDLTANNEKITRQDATIQALGIKVEKLTADIDDKNTKISTQNVEISGLKDQILKTQKANNDLDEKVNSLNDTVAQLTSQLERHADAAENSADALVKIREENTKLKQQMDELESKQNKSQADLKAELKKMMNELQEEYNERIKKKDDDINDLKQRLQSQGRAGYNSSGRQFPGNETTASTGHPTRNHPSQSQARSGQVDTNTSNENQYKIPGFQ